MMQMPFSQACENNKGPILAVLKEVFPEHQYARTLLLEIGSGTGQHAAFFASSMPWLHWQPSDQADYLPGCRLWVENAQAQGVSNLKMPLTLDVLQPQWPVASAQAAFSANTAHIMSWQAVEALFMGLGKRLEASAAFCLYGPFRYQGKHTSESNVQFDAHLRSRDPAMGIRDMDELIPLAEASGFKLEADHAMPANNRTLVWRRQ